MLGILSYHVWAMIPLAAVAVVPVLHGHRHAVSFKFVAVAIARRRSLENLEGKIVTLSFKFVFQDFQGCLGARNQVKSLSGGEKRPVKLY